MSHFAKVSEGVVTEVIVAEQEYIQTLSSPDEWIQTSYNTSDGVHKNGGTPLRKNYAAKGYSYDKTRDAFIPPKPPFSSWVLNEDSGTWEAPIAEPDDNKKHEWHEDTQEWVSSDV